MVTVLYPIELWAVRHAGVFTTSKRSKWETILVSGVSVSPVAVEHYIQCGDPRGALS